LKFNGFLSLSALMLAGVIVVLIGPPANALAQAYVDTSPKAPSAAKLAIAPTQSNSIEIGDWLVSERRYEAAINAYASSAEMTARVWNKMGIAYQLMVNSNEAIRCFKESLKLNPGDPKVWNNLGVVYESQQDWGAAERMYRKALKLDPHFALTYKNLATNLFAQRKYSQGSDAYQQAMAIDPGIFAEGKNPTVGNPAAVHERGAMNYYIALACVRAGQYDRALDHLRTALDEGFADPKKVVSNSEFASLRGNPAFQQLLAEQQRSQ
jgi:tetratricopeptide (TPR) repeat protein